MQYNAIQYKRLFSFPQDCSLLSGSLALEALLIGVHQEALYKCIDTIQYSTLQYHTIQYNTIQYNTIQCIIMGVFIQRTIYMPQTMRLEMLSLLHKDHLGIDKFKCLKIC